MEFHENPAHAQTVDTRPFFFLPRAKRAARLPAREKRGTGDEAKNDYNGDLEKIGTKSQYIYNFFLDLQGGGRKGTKSSDP